VRYLVLELHPFLFRLTDIERDQLGKQITINKHRRFSAFSELKQYLTTFPLTTIDKIIIGLDSKFTTTNFLHQKLQSHSELENLAMQLINQNLPADQFYIRNLVVDGHKTTDPINLTNNNDIRARFSRTHVNQKLLAELKKILPVDKIFLMGDSGSLITHVLSQLPFVTQSFALATSFYNTTALYKYSRGSINCFQQFNWGEKNLLSVFFGQLAVNQSTARKILNTYYQGKTSVSFSKKIDSFFAGEFDNLSQKLKASLMREGISQLYFLPLFNFPHRLLKLGRGMRVSLVDNSFTIEKLSFGLKLNKGEEIAATGLTTVLLLVAESDTIPANSPINKIIDRRLRWKKI